MRLLAARAAVRMSSRQRYRTMSRMERRRSSVESPTMSQSEPVQPPRDQAAGEEPDYVAALEQLGKLQKEGLITEEEFTAKKKQILQI